MRDSLRRASSIALAAVLSWAGAYAADSQQRPAPPGVLPSCSVDQEQRVRLVRDESAGLWLQNESPIVGPPVAARKFENEILNAAVSRGFYTVDGARHAACGTLNKWSLYNGPGAELDLHPHLNLSSRFRYLAEDLSPLGRPSDCPTCIWGEVTLPDSMRHFWSGSETGPEPPRGSIECSPGQPCTLVDFVDTDVPFCMYGPWVMERIYGFRAEIHPVEAFWGQRTPNGPIELHLGSDASNRFDSSDDFKFLGRAQNGWKEWSGVPARYTVRAAVELAAGQQRTLTISAPGTPTATQVFGGTHSTLRVVAPANLAVSGDIDCVSSRGTRFAMIRFAAPLTTTRNWLSYRFEGLDVNAPPAGKPPAIRAGEVPDENEDEVEDALAVRLLSLEWDAQRPIVNAGSLDSERSTWGLSETEPVNWRFIETQRARYELPADELKAGRFTVRWSVVTEPSTLRVGPGADVQLEFATGPGITPVVEISQGRYSTARLRNGQFSVWARFKPRLFGDGVNATPALVRLLATVERSDGRRRVKWELVLRNVAPETAAGVQDFMQWRKAKEPPEALAKRLLSIVANQGQCGRVPYATLLSHWSMAPDWSAWSVWDRAGRRGRMLKLTIFWALEDGTVEPDEQRELIAAARQYADAAGFCRR